MSDVVSTYADALYAATDVAILKFLSDQETNGHITRDEYSTIYAKLAQKNLTNSLQLAQQVEPALAKEASLVSELRRKYGVEMGVSVGATYYADGLNGNTALLSAVAPTSVNTDGVINKQIANFEVDFDMKAAESVSQMLALLVQKNAISGTSSTSLTRLQGLTDNIYDKVGDGNSAIGKAIVTSARQYDVEFRAYDYALIWIKRVDLLTASLQTNLTNVGRTKPSNYLDTLFEITFPIFDVASQYFLNLRSNQLESYVAKYKQEYSAGLSTGFSSTGDSDALGIGTGTMLDSISVEQIEGFKKNAALKNAKVLGSYIGTAVQSDYYSEDATYLSIGRYNDMIAQVSSNLTPD